MNVYMHIGFDDAEEELKRMEEFRKAQAEVEQKKEKPMSVLKAQITQRKSSLCFTPVITILRSMNSEQFFSNW